MSLDAGVSGAAAGCPLTLARLWRADQIFYRQTLPEVVSNAKARVETSGRMNLREVVNAKARVETSGRMNLREDEMDERVGKSLKKHILPMINKKNGLAFHQAIFLPRSNFGQSLIFLDLPNCYCINGPIQSRIS